MPNNRLVFLTSFEYPSKYAHPIHGLFMAQALSKSMGDRFSFVVAKAGDWLKMEDINVLTPFVNLREILKIMHLRALFYSVWLLFFSWKIKSLKTWVFINDPKIALFLSILKPLGRFRVVYEHHGLYTPLVRAIIYRLADKHIFVNSHLRNAAVKKYQTLLPKSIVLPNGVDLDAYEKISESASTLRFQLSLPADKIILGYIGRMKPLGLEKGVARLIETLSFLPEKYTLCCVGGTENEIKEYRELSEYRSVGERVIFVPHISPDQVPKYTKAFDILAYVPAGGNIFFDIETSPMKLFEYMAAGKPILASDLPTTREVLSEKSAFFVRENISAESLASEIESIVKNPRLCGEKSYEAKLLAQKYSWPSRVKIMLDFLQQP